jgi:hypothetical protein
MFLLVEREGQLPKFPELFWLPVAMADKCVHKGFVPSRTPAPPERTTHSIQHTTRAHRVYQTGATD